MNRIKVIPIICFTIFFISLLEIHAAVASSESEFACDVPTAFSGNALTQSSVRLHWVSGESNFEIAYNVTGSPASPTFVAGITSSPFDISGLDPGVNYSFMVRSNCGNPGLSAWSLSIQVSTCSAINLGPDVSLCEGQTKVLDATNMFSSFVWSNGLTSQSVQVTQTGFYSVLATSANGCVSSDGINVTFNPLPTVDLGGDITLCPGDDIVLASTSTSQGNFLWNTGSSSSSLPVTTGGNYSLTVTNTFGCSATDEVTVAVSASDIDLGADRTICAGTQTELDAGAGFNSYSWSTNQTTSAIHVAQGGSYAVTGTDAFGCEVQDQILITLRPSLQISAGADTIICQGQSSILQASSGFISYQWNTGETSRSIAPVATGIFNVQGVDVNGCTSTDEVQLTVKPLPVVDLGPDQFLCHHGILNLSVPNGNQSYSWSTGTTGNAIGVNSSGVYTLTVTSPNGCTNSDNIQIFQNPQIVIVVNALTPASCTVTSSGAADVSVSGGTQPYLFDWSDDGVGDLDDAVDRVGLPSGNFALKVVDGKGCGQQVNISIPMELDLSAPVISCGQNIVTCDPMVEFESPMATDNCAIQSLVRTDTHGLDSGHKFPVGITTIHYLAKDFAGNSSTCSFTIIVKPTPDLFVPQTISVLPGQPVSLNAIVDSNTSVHWSPENTIDDPDSKKAIARPTENTIFSVVALNTEGCRNEASVIVTLDKGSLVINNILTPNGDGLNDTWEMNDPYLIQGCEVKIYNRWGKEVYRTKSYRNEWNGTQNGAVAQEGAYYYTISCGDSAPLSGAITLVGQAK